MSNNRQEGMISYVVLITMMLFLVTGSTLLVLTQSQVEMTQKELDLVQAKYGAERGAMWFVMYIHEGGQIQKGQEIPLIETESEKIYIKRPLYEANESHIIVHSINKARHCSARCKVVFHLDKERQQLVIDSIFPY